MAWSTIRKATDVDSESLRQAAERFCQRHNIDWDGEEPEFAIDLALNPGSGCSYEHEAIAKHLNPLWRRIVKRVLGNGADGIAYGYVGFHVD